MQRGIFVTLVEHRLFYLQDDGETVRHKQDVCAKERGDTDVSSRTVPWLTTKVGRPVSKMRCGTRVTKIPRCDSPLYNSTNPHFFHSLTQKDRYFRIGLFYHVIKPAQELLP